MHRILLDVWGHALGLGLVWEGNREKNLVKASMFLLLERRILSY